MDLTARRSRAAQQLLGPGAFRLWAAMVADADDNGRLKTTLNAFLKKHNFCVRTGMRYYKQVEEAGGVRRMITGYRAPSEYKVMSPHTRVRRARPSEVA